MQDKFEQADESLDADDMDSSDDAEAKAKAKTTEDILRIARERFQLAVEAEADIRQKGLEDAKFAAGEQWPEEVKSARDQDGRPCHTINRLPQFIRQITNDAKQNRAAIKVSPVDDKGDIDTAKIFQGIIRHIEYASDADIAWDAAFENAVRRGYGFLRIKTKYADPYSFEQDIAFERIRNPDSAYLDPSYQRPDGADANWGFIFDDMPEDDFKAQFPNSEAASMDDWTSLGNSKQGWADAKSIRVAEYFYKDYVDTTIYRFSDGSVYAEGEIPRDIDPMLQVVDKRETTIIKVKWLKINAVEILEETEWPSQFIPIIPVLGEELDIDGKRILEGVVRHAKDSQRMYNYWKSSETETISLAPRSPWIVAEGQIEGYEDIWKSANRKNHAVMPYKPKSIGGAPIPPPQRNVFEPPVQAITQASMYAAEDLKATTGIYDAAMGAQSNEKSGIAIQRRANQSQTANYHFMDNLAKSRRHAGRILLELIPKIYDTARAVRILGDDGTEEVVRVNEVFEKNGKQQAHQLGVGRYDVTIATGPSFETKRQEAVQAMLDFTRAMPQQAAMVSDLLVKNMDWPGADEFADRFRKMLPPNLQEQKEGEQQPLPHAAQAQMQQMDQTISALTKELHARTEQMQSKTLELESKERIAFAQIQSANEIALLNAGSKEAMSLLGHQIGEIQSRLNNELRMQEPIVAEETPAEQPGMQPPQGPQGPSAPMQAPQMPQEQMPTGGEMPGQTPPQGAM